jgi:hypothetical protein
MRLWKYQITPLRKYNTPKIVGPKRKRPGQLGQMAYGKGEPSRHANIQTHGVSFVSHTHPPTIDLLPDCITELEDYSEYESVNSESEQPPDPSSKPKASKGAKVKASSEVKKEEIPPKISKSQTKDSTTNIDKAKSAGTSGGKKKTLDAFFSKK